MKKHLLQQPDSTAYRGLALESGRPEFESAAPAAPRCCKDQKRECIQSKVVYTPDFVQRAVLSTQDTYP